MKLIDNLGEGVEFNFAKFGNEDFIDLEMEVYAISHLANLYYSLVIGQVAFSCKNAPPPSPDRAARYSES